jgi:D-alanyl-D-alanine carboxypeptidase (penicillin-binding protein 5/6)
MAGSSRGRCLGAAALLLTAAVPTAGHAQRLDTIKSAIGLAAVTTPEPEESEESVFDAGPARSPGSGNAPAVTDPAGPKVKALSAILVDGRTGAVLWEKDARTRRPIASTTKIMTTLLLLEHANLTDTVVASKHAASTPYANLNLRPGERIPMADLLYAIMLRSANDGCVAAAEHVAGSEQAFVALMNQKARELGAVDTNFVTTNGLHDPNHYSTAEDLARIAAYAIRNPQFNALCGARTKTIRRSIAVKDSLVRNHNKLLQRYDGADGIKTGYVRQSGRCLVASATRAEGDYPWRLIAIVLNSGDTYGDTAAMLDWGFARFHPVVLARRGARVAMVRVRGGSPEEVPAIATDDLIAVVPREGASRAFGGSLPVDHRLQLAELKPPILRDQPIGTMCSVVNGRVQRSMPLVAGAAVELDRAASVGRFGGWGVALLAVFGIRGYARSLAKGARRRRRRLPARGRGVDRRGAGPRRRTGGHPAWDEGRPGVRPDRCRWA